MSKGRELVQAGLGSTRKQELTETKAKLREIFEYYASFGDRLNKKLLSSGKFFKILQDSNLNLVNANRDSLENRKQADIIFSQVNSNKSHMPFEVFLHSMIRMGELKYPHYSAGDALKAIVSGYMLPLHNKIRNGTQYDRGASKPLEHDELVAMVLRDVGPILFEIYQVYFSHEVRGLGGMTEVAIWRTNEKSVYEFLNDYDICPGLLTKSATHQILSQVKAQPAVYGAAGRDVATVEAFQRQTTVSPTKVLSNPKVGRVFTFYKFLDFLIRAAKMTFSRDGCHGLTGGESLVYSAYKGQRLLEAEMVCLLLERMEMSEGFQNHEKKTHKPHSSKITLLPSRQVVENIHDARGFLVN